MEAVTPTCIDIAHLMCDSNRTLTIINNQTSGWQKANACSITCHGSVALHQLQMSTCTTLCSAQLPGITIWLAYETALKTPIICGQHGPPLYDAAVHAERVTFRVSCSAKCFHTTTICIVVAECMPQHQTIQWNYCIGGFRRNGQQKIQHASLSDTSPPSLEEKIDILTAKLTALCTLVEEMDRNQRIMYHQSRPYDNSMPPLFPDDLL